MITIKEQFTTHYSQYLDSITNISFDDDNKESLCVSDKKFLNYDAIVQQITRSTGDGLRSPDLICFDEKGIINFIEFKNGNLDKSAKKIDLKLKGIEGGFIALYKAIKQYQSTVSFEEILMLKKNYYIVYNSGKNQSKSRIAGIVNHLAATKIRFGLERYKGTFFNEIITVSENIFISTILPHIN